MTEFAPLTPLTASSTLSLIICEKLKTTPGKGGEFYLTDVVAQAVAAGVRVEALLADNEEAALGVNGALAVANEIEVRLPIAAARTDADIAAAALYALEWDANVPLDRVKVAVSDGWVSLTGEVDKQHQREAAEQAVSRLLGVRGVTNHISSS